MRLLRRLDRRLYGGIASEADILDRDIQANLSTAIRVLDVGCGAGKLFPRDYRTPERVIVGIDVDSSIWQNRVLDHCVYGSAETMPFRSQVFDLIYSRYVAEHLPDPAAVFREVSRTLRSNGKFILLTPNAFHYVPTIARLTPQWFHKLFNARARGRNTADTFPTFYRANSVRRLNALARGAGLRKVKVQMIETRPNYLAWSLPTFVAGPSTSVSSIRPNCCAISE